MPRRHALLAALIAAAWGVNFVVIELGLDDFPPLLFAALRFAAVFAAALWIAPPRDVPVRLVLLVGLLLSAGHFGFLFVAMDAGMPAGLASLVLQLQSVFTIVLAVLLIGERLTRAQAAGAAVALAGMGVIALGRSAGIPLVALLLVVAAAASWGAGNVAVRHAQTARPAALLVWSSIVPAVLLGALSLAVEGPGEVGRALAGIDPGGAAALAYLVFVATAFGFGAWTWLLGRHPASRVAPFTLLVPVFGMGAAWMVLGETPNLAESAGAVLVVAGLALPYVASGTAIPLGGSSPGASPRSKPAAA